MYTWGPLKVFEANFPRYEMCYKMYEDSSLRRPNAENITVGKYKRKMI